MQGVPRRCPGGIGQILALAALNLLGPAASAQGQPSAPYRDLRSQLSGELDSCLAAPSGPACNQARLVLQALIRVSERPMQRQLRPRCLGALSQLETHLSVFSWGLEPAERLQQQRDQAMLLCPAPAVSAPPSASS